MTDTFWLIKNKLTLITFFVYVIKNSGDGDNHALFMKVVVNYEIHCSMYIFMYYSYNNSCCNYKFYTIVIFRLNVVVFFQGKVLFS